MVAGGLCNYVDQLTELAGNVPPLSELNSLFPGEVVVVERRLPGDPATLLPAEARHVARARRKRLEEFAAGRVCARAALAHFGVLDFALEAAEDRQPKWPAGFVGSITHTAGLCVAAVGRSVEVMALGLDSEIVGAPTSDIWETICRPDELRWVRTLPSGDQPAAVTLIFSAKEAFYKCQYPLAREWLDFHDLAVEIRAWGEPFGRFEVSATRALRFSQHARLPAEGRHLFHQQFVTAAVTILQ